MVKGLNRALIESRGIGRKAAVIALDKPDVENSVAIWKRQLESTPAHGISECMGKAKHLSTGDTR
jgi:hypothetical protein